MPPQTLTEQLKRLTGHSFKNVSLAEEALTHRSAVADGKGAPSHNERLEFLGDAVLELVLSRFLYDQFPDFSEGRLTKLRAELANRKTLGRVARQMGLGEVLILGKSEEITGGRSRVSNLGNALESLMGAIYLDAGAEAARKFIIHALHEDIERLKDSPVEQNPKGELQELIQKKYAQAPVYELISETGKSHEKVFECRVVWAGRERGRGSGKSKKSAETAAAASALASLGPKEKE